MHTQLVTWKHIAHGAVYDSLRHFLDGDSVYLPPRNLTELREVLYVPLSFFSFFSQLTPTSRERGAMSYMFTYISQLRGGLRGTEFTTVRIPHSTLPAPISHAFQMKQIAYDSLRDILGKNANDFLQLYSNKADWHAKPPRALRQAGPTLT